MEERGHGGSLPWEVCMTAEAGSRRRQAGRRTSRQALCIYSSAGPTGASPPPPPPAHVTSPARRWQVNTERRATGTAAAAAAASLEKERVQGQEKEEEEEERGFDNSELSKKRWDVIIVRSRARQGGGGRERGVMLVRSDKNMRVKVLLHMQQKHMRANM